MKLGIPLFCKILIIAFKTPKSKDLLLTAKGFFTLYEVLSEERRK